MQNNWIGSGPWDGWIIKGDKLISPSGRAYGPSDIETSKYSQSDLAKALGVTRAAINDRVRRGSLPPFDDPAKKTWLVSSVQHLFLS